MLFFGGFSLKGSLVALRPSTGDTLRLRQRRAASRLQTDISRADRDFSLALSLFSTQSTWRRSRCNVTMSDMGGFSVAQAALKDCYWLLELASQLFSGVVFLLFQVVSFSDFLKFECGRRRGQWHGYLSGGWDGVIYLARETTQERKHEE